MEEGEPVIETSDATSSSEVVQMSTSPVLEKTEVKEEMEETCLSVAVDQPLDVEGCRQQLLQQQLLLHHIQLQHLHNSSIDEQVCKLNS